MEKRYAERFTNAILVAQLTLVSSVKNISHFIEIKQNLEI